MTRRDFVAGLIGAGVALAIGRTWMMTNVDIVRPAYAQQEALPERQRFLVLAIANAIASVAVDGERTALVVNDTIDEVKALQERLGNLEKRLSRIEGNR